VSKRYLETIKSLDGELFHLEYHQWRLERALDTKDTHNLNALLSPPKKGLYRCRVVYNHNGICVEYIPYFKHQIHSLKLVYNDTIEYEKKYENRDSLNALFKQKERADDIIIIKNSLITDTSIANIAFYDGEIWVTPKSPLLEGTTRKRFLDLGKIVERDIRVEEISSFKKLALMNAMIDFDIIAEENIEDIIC
jgi:4-amino-4-deoxychorismate lyase